MKDEHILAGIVIAALFALTILCCYGIDAAQKDTSVKAEKQPTEHLYIVEDKGVHHLWGGGETYYLVVSDTLTHRPTTRGIGKYMYEQAEVGDTIRFFE